MNKRKQTLILTISIVIILMSIFLAGICMSEETVAADFANAKLTPSMQHLFGTDWLGRDLLARTIKGLSISMIVGITASAMSTVVAVFIGMTSAIGSKKVDALINWVIDLVMGVPHLILIILISFACGRGLKGLLIGIAVTHWTNLARIIRAEVLQLRTEQYIAVSKKLGRNYGFILRYHILPHMLPQLMVGLVLMFPHAILHEASITFLGYGLSPEQPAIGIILSESMKYLSSGMWWLAFFPGLTLVIIVFLFDRLGDNLKALVDPYSAQE